ncbi:hypothetical protein BYT27DRAFT_7248408 [Phlegmacium glaucopus]|nr:hypothetical protein BYT27DRAFT_7248408 [Phlegmacium glaucopus]
MFDPVHLSSMTNYEFRPESKQFGVNMLYSATISGSSCYNTALWSWCAHFQSDRSSSFQPNLQSYTPTKPNFEHEQQGCSSTRHEVDSEPSITSSDRLYEWEASWSPVWNSIGIHVHLTNELVEIAKGYLSRVDEIRNILPRKQDKDIIQALITSDEEDLAFWSDVRAYDWVYLNRTEERTQERLGEWFIPIVDIVPQSLAIGFVGTQQSTFSLVIAWRVEDWNDGPTIHVPRW